MELAIIDTYYHYYHWIKHLTDHSISVVWSVIVIIIIQCGPKIAQPNEKKKWNCVEKIQNYDWTVAKIDYSGSQLMFEMSSTLSDAPQTSLFNRFTNPDHLPLTLVSDTVPSSFAAKKKNIRFARGFTDRSRW